ARRLMRLDEDAPRLERCRDAHERAGRAEPVAERGDAATRLLPDLHREVLAVMRDRIGAVELICRIVARQCSQLARALNHVLDVLRRDARTALGGFDDVEVRAP